MNVFEDEGYMRFAIVHNVNRKWKINVEHKR